MMKNSIIRRILAVSMMVVMVFALAACGNNDANTGDNGGNEEKQETIVLKLNHAQVADGKTLWSQMAKEFARLTEEHTDGRLELQVFGEGEMYKNYLDMTMGVTEGTTDLALSPMNAIAYHGYPEVFVSMTPRLIKSYEQQQAYCDGDALKELDEVFYEMGGTRLGSLPISSYFMYFREPIESLEGFDGKIVRIAGGPVAEGAKALGLVTNQMSQGEVFGALQQGIIDGVGGGIDDYINRKWYEVAPYMVAGNMQLDWYSLEILANNETWEGLPEDLRKIMEEKVIPETLEFSRNLERKAFEDNMNAVKNNPDVTIVQMPAAEIEKIDNRIAEVAHPIIRSSSELMERMFTEALKYSE